MAQLAVSSNLNSGNSVSQGAFSRPKSRRKRWVFWSGVVLVFLTAIIVNSPVSKGYFLADDFVALNQLVLKQTSFVDNLVWFARDWGIGANFYRPLIRLGYYFQYLFFGDNAFGWHCISIGLHAINTVLVLWLAYLLSKRRSVGLLAGLIFAIQPIHSEPVAWISGQTDLWATLFCLASIGCFISFRQKQDAGKNNWLLQIFALLSFVLALCSKETSAALPVALLMYEVVSGGFNRLFLQTKSRVKTSSIFRLLVDHIPFWIVLGLYIILRIVLFKGLGGYITVAGQQPDIILFLRSNVRWLLLPFSVSGTDGFTFVIIVAAFLILTGVQEWEISSGVPVFNSLRTAGFGFLWTIVFLLPAALVQPAERFTYLPSVGFALFTAAILAPFPSLLDNGIRYREIVWWLRTTAIVVVVVAYVASTTGREQSWIQAGNIANQYLQNTQAVITKRNMPHYSYLYGENIPDDISGAYLFRTGYSEAIQWLYHDDTITAFKVSKFPIVEDHLGQTIFLEYKSDGNIVNHLQVQSILKERFQNIKSQKPFQVWDFALSTDTALLDNWYETDGVNQVEIRDGALIPHAPGQTVLRNNNLGFPAFQTGAIEVTLKAEANSTSPIVASAIWQTTHNTEGEVLQTDPANFNIIADGNYHTYRIMPRITPRNINGQLMSNIPLEDEITTVQLVLPAGLKNLQIQKITQFQIPSTYTLPLGTSN